MASGNKLAQNVLGDVLKGLYGQAVDATTPMRSSAGTQVYDQFSWYTLRDNIEGTGLSIKDRVLRTHSRRESKIDSFVQLTLAGVSYPLFEMSAYSPLSSTTDVDPPIRPCLVRGFRQLEANAGYSIAHPGPEESLVVGLGNLGITGPLPDEPFGETRADDSMLATELEPEDILRTAIVNEGILRNIHAARLILGGVKAKDVIESLGRPPAWQVQQTRLLVAPISA